MSTFRFALATAVIAASAGAGAYFGTRSAVSAPPPFPAPIEARLAAEVTGDDPHAGVPGAPHDLAAAPHAEVAGGVDPAEPKAYPPLDPEVKRANQLFREKKYDDARKIYEALIAKDPNDAVARYGLAMTLDKAGDGGRAAAEYGKLGFDAGSARLNHGAEGAGALGGPHGGPGAQAPLGFDPKALPFGEGAPGVSR